MMLMEQWEWDHVHCHHQKVSECSSDVCEQKNAQPSTILYVQSFVISNKKY